MPCLCMPVQQGSLAQLLQKQLLTPWNFIYDSVQALAWSMQVAEALQHMHTGGVLHRDIKAENVLLTWEGRELVARLADLGLHRVSVLAPVSNALLAVCTGLMTKTLPALCL